MRNSKEEKRFTDVKYYSDVAGVLQTGKKDVHLRGEDASLPANLVSIPEWVSLYVARDKQAKEPYEKFAAYIEVNGKPVILDCASTRKELHNQLSFSIVNSHFTPSVWYRTFRNAYGHDWGSANYHTPEQKKENADQALNMLIGIARVLHEEGGR